MDEIAISTYNGMKNWPCKAHSASGQALAKAAHFDTAFVAEGLALYKSEGGISGK